MERTVKIRYRVRRALRGRVYTIPFNMLMEELLFILNKTQRLSVCEPPHLRANHRTNEVSQACPDTDTVRQ